MRQVHEKANGADHPYAAVALSNLAALCLDLGRYGDEEAYARKALEADQRSFGEDNVELCAAHGLRPPRG